MATMYCPHCHTKTSITHATQRVEFVSSAKIVNVVWTTNKGYWWIGICNGCHKPVLVFKEGEIIWPTPMPSTTASEIPIEIRENLIEAKSCAAVNAYRASVVMCRRALQMACIGRGANAEDNLVAQINYLKTAAVITGDLHEWATVVRWVGNDGAHPGGAEIDKEDAENMLDLTEQFLHVLYVAPAKAAAHRAKLRK
ncbi:DUF4145 domain-containing protein [Deinococcus wulumuqiensis]|uniref:DUF4145 domain-containing protein n=1 Tax=Deinococcus wulumuqiensis TaxID=980427 RepID=A0A345II42_9DEIO|nr:DUF4145 domain-containing protein [Deinococcus wulumuqiensis]AXG99364.1 DUF4145 domain-containing protein [Deinococcus wulumuqiensis]